MAFIIPDVYADLAQAKFAGKVKVLGSPAVVDDTTLEGQPGEKINFPRWGALGELDDLTKGTDMVPVEMGQVQDTSAVIKEAGKAVKIHDRDKLTALGGEGGAQGAAIEQFGILAARKVDGDLITEAITNGGHKITTTAGTTTFGWGTLNQGFATFGDEAEPEEFAGIYIHSQQLNEAYADPQFVDASKVGDNSLVRRGVIGLLRGVPVYVSDRLTAGQFLIMKNGVLGALSKRKPIVETDRSILGRYDVVTTNVHYAVKAITPSGIAVVTLAAA